MVVKQGSKNVAPGNKSVGLRIQVYQKMLVTEIYFLLEKVCDLLAKNEDSQFTNNSFTDLNCRAKDTSLGIEIRKCMKSCKSICPKDGV